MLRCSIIHKIMSINQTEVGRSVYCVTPFEERVNQPHYEVLRGFVRKYSKSRHILDLGCSDLVATQPLQKEGYSIYGIDIDLSSLLEARSNSLQASLIHGDINNLPFRNLGEIDTILLADTLEHVTKAEAISLLKNIASIGGSPLTIVVAMPIIHNYSVPYLMEALQTKVAGERPKTGLLDRTHKILTDTEGHRRIFEEAGYLVQEETLTLFGERNPVSKFLLHTILPRSLHPFDQKRRENTINRFTACQGIYVIKPT